MARHVMIAYKVTVGDNLSGYMSKPAHSHVTHADS